jgi:hypothetical protein
VVTTVTLPETRIGTHPKGKTHRRTARFTFGGTSGTTTAGATWTSPAGSSTPTSATSTRRSSPRSRSRPRG